MQVDGEEDRPARAEAEALLRAGRLFEARCTAQDALGADGPDAGLAQRLREPAPGYPQALRVEQAASRRGGIVGRTGPQPPSVVPGRPPSTAARLSCQPSDHRAVSLT